MSTNFAKTLVWKHEYDVKLRRHKDCTPQTNDHHMPLNQIPPHENFLRPPLFIIIILLCEAPHLMRSKPATSRKEPGNCLHKFFFKNMFSC